VIFVWLIFCMGVIVALAFVYLRRVEDSPTARIWAWAWFTFVTGVVLTPPSDLVTEVVSHGLGTLFPALLLAGALTFTARSIPRWLLPGAAGVGILRGFLSVGGAHVPLTVITSCVEPTLDFVGAFLLFQVAATPRRSLTVTMLAASYVATGAMELWMSSVGVLDSSGIQDQQLLLAVGASTSLILALAQLLALGDRVRERERTAMLTHARDLDLLRRVAEAGTSHDETSLFLGEACTIIREELDADAGGVFLLSEDGATLECAHHFGAGDELPAEATRTPRDLPISDWVLTTREPLFVDDLADEAGPARSLVIEVGIRHAAVIPLHRHERSIGTFVVAMKPPKEFSETDRRLLVAVSKQLALGLQRVQAAEDRRREAAALAAERRTLGAVVDTAPLGILVQDREGLIVLINRTLSNFAGPGRENAWVGRSVADFFRFCAPILRDPEHLAAEVAELRRHPDLVIEDFPLHLNEPGDGLLLLFSSPVRAESGESLGRVWIARDVTQERRLEDELRQSQKLETLGTLAGGVAHDFNNHLMVILGNASLLRSAVSGDRRLSEGLRDLELSGRHCMELTRGLLTFARRAPISIQCVDPQSILRDVEGMLRPIIPSSIEVRVNVADDVWNVTADATQLQGVLINLAVNARDSIEGGGEIAIDVANRDVEPSEIRSQPNARSGRFVEFTVQDDGCGMATDTIEHIFDPFYTTKPVGEGTGLGLAVVYGVVQSHGGWIEVDSQPGAGCTFRILLPAAEKEAEDPSDSEAAGGRDPGTETVLVADDEAALRRLVRNTLVEQGYRVVEAEDGDEAVRCFRDLTGEIQLVVLDQTMPRRDGFATLEAIRAIDPDVPAVIISGYSVAQEADDAGARFLAKPFDPEGLAQLVRTILDDVPA
jgi:signal transduction histidine kinase